MFNNIYDEFLLMTIAINLLVVVFMLSIVFMYSRYKLKTSFNKTLGLGDVLLFLALAFSFASVSFIVLFVFGLVFSLILHLILKQKSKLQTVPLAGYLSLFFAISYLAYWTGFLPTLYIL
ncbi:hypothetical protein [Winogradskyella wandonensis]|nr:hypothetical protein [Winogradskyella wandonensis]